MTEPTTEASPYPDPSPHVHAAVLEIRETGRPALERAEALVDLAMDLQKKPKAAQDLFDCLYLYDQAVSLADGYPLARARALAGRGSALRRMPGSGLDELVAAREAFEEALPTLRDIGEDEERAEVEMSYGVVLQALANAHKATLPQAIAAYQRALSFFQRERFPREYAILHNNLATAYLSMPMATEHAKMREAMAVTSFQEALKVVTIEEDPAEYAMLQNNLGNALQAVRTTHRFENLLRAVEAYDEALRVRTEYDMPVEFANTMANKANALMNLPDDFEAPEKGNPKRVHEALELLRNAQRVFHANHLGDRAQVVAELVDELSRDLLQQTGNAN